MNLARLTDQRVHRATRIDPEASIGRLAGGVESGRYWDRTSDLFGVNADRLYFDVPGSVLECC